MAFLQHLNKIHTSWMSKRSMTYVTVSNPKYSFITYIHIT